MNDLYRYKADMVRPIDGDTLEVMFNLGFNIRFKQTVRLHGVNTPEIFGKHASEAGRKAAAFTAEWLSGAASLIVESNHYDAREKFGRVLATVFRETKDGPDPEPLNDALLRTGNAVAYMVGG